MVGGHSVSKGLAPFLVETGKTIVVKQRKGLRKT